MQPAKQEEPKKKLRSSELTIGIFDFCTDCILHINFRWLNLKVFKLDSDEFRSYTNKLLSNTARQINYDYFDKMIQNSNGFGQYLYAFVPIDKKKNVPEETFQLIGSTLQLMFPSDVVLRRVIRLYEYGVDGEKGYSMGSWTSYSNTVLSAILREPKYIFTP